MESNDLLKIIAEELEKKYAAHSIILYGSRASGNETSASDVDIALFTDLIDETTRDARIVHGIYLDGFIYPTKIFSQVDDSLLKMRNGLILKDGLNLCKPFLEEIEKLFFRGPKPLSKDDIQVRNTWAFKMLERVKIEDVEGNYRRVWLLMSLIEDFFVVRGEWYLGPKESFKQLKTRFPEIFSLYEKALTQNASIGDIEALVKTVAKASEALCPF